MQSPCFVNCGAPWCKTECRLVSDERMLREAGRTEPCTGLAAQWCPNCGDCCCPVNEDGEREDESLGRNLGCPLHGWTSRHAEGLLS